MGKKIFEVFMVETEINGAIAKLENKLMYIGNKHHWKTKKPNGQWRHQHLYLTNNDKIELGDWITDGKILHKVETLLDGYIGLYKIVMTTDESLGLPLVEEALVKEYCKQNGHNFKQVVFEITKEESCYLGKPIVRKLSFKEQLIEWINEEIKNTNNNDKFVYERVLEKIKTLNK